ncbi:hypothetical protein FRC09_014329 [Ceratobasidium sp. 395]|nr:hypothetical protein FRC09_014329 [Ceratobasidium sp. 395]
MVEIPDNSTGYEREGSAGLDIPGSFASSPVNYGHGADQPPPNGNNSDEIDARIAEAHIPVLEACMDDVSCPPRASIAGVDAPACPQVESTGDLPYPTASIGGRTLGSMPCPTPSRNYTATPSFHVHAEATMRHGDEPSTTPFQTPSRKAKGYVSAPSVKLDGAKYFGKLISTTNSVDDTYVENETEQKSDETLKNSAKPKPKSEGQKHEEDMAYLRQIIKEKREKRRKREQKAPTVDEIPNSKPILKEVREALSSSEEYGSSLWEDDIYPIPSQDNEPSVKLWMLDDSPPRDSPQAGPSYFDKGKWVHDEDFEAALAFKKSRKLHTPPKEPETPAPPSPKHKTRRARPSLGIRIDDVCPAKPPQPPKTPAYEPDLKSSLAALPGGRYFADKMCAKSLGPDQSKSESSRSKKKQNPPSSSDSSSSTSSSESSDESDDPSSTESSSEPEDSDDSSSESSSSSNEDKQKLTKKQRRRIAKRKAYRCKKLRKMKSKLRKARRASVKLKEPTAYAGQADYDKFELWVYELEQWLKESGFKKKKAVRYTGTFLTEKAAQWYIDFVAPDPKKYTVDLIKIGLFSYCFPPDLKAQLRQDFKYARQGETKFIDYLRQLRWLQRRIPDITDRQICIKLWDTVQSYLKIKWIEAGIDAETADIETMRESAERFEAAEEVKRRAQALAEKYGRRLFKQLSKHVSTGFSQGNPRHTSQSSSNAAPQSQTQDNGAGPSQPRNKTRNHPNSTKPPNKPRDQRNKPARSKMSKEERNELRAAGKCFSCKETGHTVKDCPSRNTAKPSGVYSAALQPTYDHIEKLRKDREMASIPVASMHPYNVPFNTIEEIDESNESDDSDTSYRTLEVETSHAGNLLTEILEELTPYACQIVTDEDRFRVTTNNLITFDMTYAEIAQQVRESCLAAERQRLRPQLENNQGLPPIPKEEVAALAREEIVAETTAIEEEERTYPVEGEWEITWTDSDDEETQKPIAGPSFRHSTPIDEDLSIRLNAVRVGDNKRGEPSTRVVERNTSRPKDIVKPNYYKTATTR